MTLADVEYMYACEYIHDCTEQRTRPTYIMYSLWHCRLINYSNLR
jgi:hypothetical protein